MGVPLIPLALLHLDSSSSSTARSRHQLLEQYGTGCGIAAVLLVALLAYLASTFPNPNANLSSDASSLSHGGLLSSNMARLLLFLGSCFAALTAYSWSLHGSTPANFRLWLSPAAVALALEVMWLHGVHGDCCKGKSRSAVGSSRSSFALKSPLMS